MKYIIPAFYLMWGKVVVEADSLEEAMDNIIDEKLPLPSLNYVDNSVEVDIHGIPIYNELSIDDKTVLDDYKEIKDS